MSKVFFTADTHFGHANIIKYCNRPFSNVEEMDKAIIDNWNSVVATNDLVYHLGDFCMGGSDDVRSYSSRLTGKIILIKGNHDKPNTLRHHRWIGVHDTYLEIKLQGIDITLCHYAMRVWNHSFHGQSLMLYGHSHGELPPIKNSLDVGVDCWDFMPVTLEQIQERMRRFDAQQ